MPYKKYFLSPLSKQLLIDYYDGSTENIDKLVNILGVPRWRILRWAHQYQLQKVRTWKPEEDQIIESQYSKANIEDLSAQLKRSPKAISWRATQLGIRKTSEALTVASLAEALGIPQYKVKRWIDQGWLRGTKRHTRRQEGDWWYISEAAVKAFIKAHPTEIDPLKADWIWLVSILCGDD